MNVIQQSPSIANLVKALVAFSAEMPQVEKTKTVKVKTKSGHEYTFDYAPLEEITSVAKPILLKNKLVVIQLPSGNGLMTMIAHESGEFIYAVADFSTTASTNQEQGSQMTYMRRYGYTAGLGIISEDDDDANGADGNAVNQGPRPTAPSAPRPSAPAPYPAQNSGEQKEWLNALDKNGMPTKRGLDALNWLIENNAGVKELREKFAINKADAQWLQGMLSQAGPKGSFPDLSNASDEDGLPF